MCMCAAGYYSDSPGDSCKKCPKGTFCATSSVTGTSIKPGWKSPAGRKNISKCSAKWATRAPTAPAQRVRRARSRRRRTQLCAQYAQLSPPRLLRATRPPTARTLQGTQGSTTARVWWLYLREIPTLKQLRIQFIRWANAMKTAMRFVGHSDQDTLVIGFLRET